MAPGLGILQLNTVVYAPEDIFSSTIEADITCIPQSMASQAFEPKPGLKICQEQIRECSLVKPFHVKVITGHEQRLHILSATESASSNRF